MPIFHFLLTAQKTPECESPQIMEERSRLFYLAVYESESRIAGIADWI